jgi:hypothetical protein
MSFVPLEKPVASLVGSVWSTDEQLPHYRLVSHEQLEVYQEK